MYFDLKSTIQEKIGRIFEHENKAKKAAPQGALGKITFPHHIARGPQHKRPSLQQSLDISQQVFVTSQQSLIMLQQALVTSQQYLIMPQQDLVPSQQVLVTIGPHYIKKALVTSQQALITSQQAHITMQGPLSIATGPHYIATGPHYIKKGPSHITTGPHHITAGPQNHAEALVNCNRPSLRHNR